MKLIILAISFIASSKTYQYKVVDLETKIEGVYFSPVKYNAKDTIILR
jgi:hypothetical protein